MTNFNSVLQAFLHWEEFSPDKVFLRQYINGKPETLSFKESGRQIRQIARAILNKDLAPKSNIALLSKNCDSWIMADLAIMMSGHISVPIYPTLIDTSIKPIIEHSDSKLLFVGKLDNYDSQRNAFEHIPKISVEKYGINEAETWESLLERNEPLEKITLPDPKDLATIIYTSGTTGSPKGVMHSHENFSNAARNLINTLALPTHTSYFSYLPLSHIAERIGLEMGALYIGGSLTFSESLDSFASNWKRPNLICSLQYREFMQNSRKKFWKDYPRKNSIPCCEFHF